MLFRRTPPPPHPPFAALPVTEICPGGGERRIAVHVRGDLASGQLPLVALSAYHRNMTDFSGFIGRFAGHTDARQPIVLIDLAGRGRSAPLPKSVNYSTLLDAEDVFAVVDALGITRAAFLGIGHGGQVIMAMSVRRPGTIAGAVLIDSGPVADSRGLVRLRNNLRHIEALRAATPAREAMRRVLATDYPSADGAQLDALAERVFRFDLRNRVTPLYDRRLIARLDAFDFDDIFEPQWPLFDTLSSAPLMLIRTQLTDLLRRETFEEMTRRRRDAATLTIEGEGTPPLLEQTEAVARIAEFVKEAGRKPT